MGAAIALRWAGQDPRIAGVLAQSPFVNALDATAKFRPEDKRVRFFRAAFVHGGIRRMLQEVDIPTAVARRDDLLLWLTAGEHDYFPESDQRMIMTASASPDWLKKLVIIPGAHHGEQWKWAGNDALIREFLATAVAPSTASRFSSRSAAAWATASIAAAAAIHLWHRIKAHPTRWQTLGDNVRHLWHRGSRWR